jgi:hypothetical protein|tara:strand:+ start:409 stop:714 length:306 start_codon:yes stop_codon:yes gene_type:complete
MSEILKALQDLPPVPKKVHTVTIQGQSLVVSLEKKLEVMKNGEDAYTWKSPTEIMLKPKTKPKTQYPILKKATKGYLFQDGDIHWPNAVAEGGETWLIEQE